MTAAPAFVECPINGGHKLRIEFLKQGDRYAHRLSAVLVDEAGGETVVPLAESVEGAGDDPWPPSPPLQSLSIEELRDGRTAALLVGMAGRSHWSGSIEVDCIRRHGPPKFELACRFLTLPQRLGSTYRAAPGVVLREHKSIAYLLEGQAGIAASIQCIVGGRWIRPISNFETGVFEFQLPLEKLTPPATAQWCYTLDGQQVDPDIMRKKLTA